jgi:hypothetical protein
VQKRFFRYNHFMRANRTLLILASLLVSLTSEAQHTPQPQTQQEQAVAPVQPVTTDKPNCIPVASSKSPIKKTHVPKKLAAFWDKQRAKISDKIGVDLGSAQDIKDSLTPPPCPVVPAAPAAQATPVTAK